MKKTVITFGVIAGVVIASIMGISLVFAKQLEDYHIAELLGWGSMILALSTIFFAIKTYRDKHNDGVIKFGKAFLIGIYITLIASAVHTVSWAVYSEFGSGKEVMEGYFKAQVEQVKSQNLSQEEEEKKLAEMEKQKQFYMNPLFHYPIVFLTEVPTAGIPISLICSLILMRRKP